MNQNAIPQVRLQVYRVQPALLRVDLFADNLPRHFLGVGFDLVIQGASWSMQKHQLGDDLQSFTQLLEMASERSDPHRIVFGLSVKNGPQGLPDLPAAYSQKNLLASFFLRIGTDKIQTVTFAFDHTVMSVFDGRRQDLEHVDWKGTQMLLSGNVAEQSSGQAVAEKGELSTSILHGATIADVPDDAGFPGAFAIPYLILGLTFLVGLLVFLAILRRNWRRNRPENEK